MWSGVGVGLSILLMARPSGTPAALRVVDRLDRLRHDVVVSRHVIATSVTRGTRGRAGRKASWPGVSEGDLRPLGSTLLGTNMLR